MIEQLLIMIHFSKNRIVSEKKYACYKSKQKGVDLSYFVCNTVLKFVTTFVGMHVFYNL